MRKHLISLNREKISLIKKENKMAENGQENINEVSIVKDQEVSLKNNIVNIVEENNILINI